ncbi:MAG: PQQ-binding-like beta-propeller repeat protein [Cyclobacteriaceae bacterium]
MKQPKARFLPKGMYTGKNSCPDYWIDRKAHSPIGRLKCVLFRKATKLPAIVISLFLLSCASHVEPTVDWPAYGGNKAGNRYSALDQINRENVQQLEVAWTYNTVKSNKDSMKLQGIQCQPIVIDGILYGTGPGPRLELFAIDAASGQEKWVFTPSNTGNKSRGLAYWASGADQRILYSVGPALYAVDATSGVLVKAFGDNGVVDLHTGLSDNQDKSVSGLGIASSSPGAVYKNTFIVGSSMTESGKAPPGHVRAFDIPTGKLKWVFHTIPHPGEDGYETWPENAYKEIGGANNWSGLVVDERRGEVYFGTGSPSSDFYGGNRRGQNLFANCIVALNAETGTLKWYFQTIHHDLWDRDIPCPPNLTTITLDGKPVDVAVQATKDGVIYVLNRDTGESVFPIEERPVPTIGLPGEHPFPTQKYPVKPLPFSRQVYTEEDITNISPESEAYIKELFVKYKTDNKFTPPSTKGTLLFGYSGGAEWGGNAIDMDGILYQNSNDDPWILEMIDAKTREERMETVSSDKGLFDITCATCHGVDRKGNGSTFPDISKIHERLTQDEVLKVVNKGKGLMPPFQHLSGQQKDMIVDYLFNVTNKVYSENNGGAKNPTWDNNQFGFKPTYIAKTWKKLLDQGGYPGIKPPWGTLNAIDLNTGDYLWRVPLGEFPELTKKGISITGTESYGGPIVTAGGLIFIAGTKDERIRAFDKKTGEVVWQYQLPAGGFATPVTYLVNGKQYVAIAAGGGRGQKPGSNYIAFALPDSGKF